MIKDDLSGWWLNIKDFLPEVSLALLILVVSFTIGRFAQKYVAQAVGRFNKQRSLANLVGRITSLFIILVGALLALQTVNLDGVVTSVLAGAGIVGIALGFAFQDIASNFIAGVVIAIQKQYNVGDLVEINEVFGVVRKIELRNTTIRTLDGQWVYIPNKDIFTNMLTDYNGQPNRRVTISAGVSYKDDLEKAEKLTLEAIKQLKQTLKDEPIDFYYQEFGESSINFIARFWIPFKNQPDFLQAQSDAIKVIKASFDKHGITIPFPIRTLDFTGPKGAKSLSQHLSGS